MSKIILASDSPRRKELLAKVCKEFSILPANIDEKVPDDIGIEFAPVFLAAEKAQTVSKRFPEYTVIGADTVVILGDKMIGKPKDDKDAVETLRSLSGQTHKVITGVCLAKGENTSCFSEETYVEFFDLTDSEIEEYVSSGASRGKAGSYGIQDDGALFVRRIDGDFYNVIGLPIARLKRELGSFSD